MKKKYVVVILFLLVLLLSARAAHQHARNFLDYCQGLPIVTRYLEEKYPKDEKFWLHRTDCLEKLREKGGDYAGVEFDLNWYDDAQDFDVSHDLGEGVYFPLEDFLAELPQGKHVWFDYKNLDTKNAQASLERMEELMLRYGVEKSQVIVENHDWRGLKTFHDAGFYTSFYVPVDDYFLNSEVGHQRFATILKEAVDSGAVSAVSFPVGYYRLVKSLNLPVDMLTWSSGDRWYKFYIKKDFAKVHEDPQVKVILILDKASMNR